MNQRLFKTTLFVFVALVSGVVSAQGPLNRRAGLLNSRAGQRSAQRAGGAQQAPAGGLPVSGGMKKVYSQFPI